MLRPATQAISVRRLPSAHMAASAMFRVSAATAPAGDAGARDEEPPRDAVTTKTDLWLDRRGQYRLSEINDQDGGRQVVHYGHDLAVALRHGKMIRRPALEPEPTHLLEEAVGAPWAAWETVRRFATVTRGPAGYQLTRSTGQVVVVRSVAASNSLRSWRDTVQVEDLAGEARVDPRTGALLAFTLNAHFSASRNDVPLSGEVVVTSRIDSIGSTPSIAAPAAEELDPRPRSIIEERALLGDLSRTVGGGGKESR